MNKIRISNKFCKKYFINIYIKLQSMLVGRTWQKVALRERLDAMGVKAQRGAAFGLGQVACAGARVQRQRRFVLLEHVPVHAGHALRHRHLCTDHASVACQLCIYLLSINRPVVSSHGSNIIPDKNVVEYVARPLIGAHLGARTSPPNKRRGRSSWNKRECRAPAPAAVHRSPPTARRTTAARTQTRRALNLQQRRYVTNFPAMALPKE